MKCPDLDGAIPFPYAFEARVAEAWPPHLWSRVTVVLAVSGGADSVALLRATHAIRGSGPGGLFVAHLNHRLRGRDSDSDQAFVEDLCRQFALPCEAESLPDNWLPDRGGDGLEAAARTARYEFLRRTACRVGARYVLTAHTADDQAETILHRIVRGTGIAGLSGISQARTLGPATLVRPLLGLRRADVLAYLGDLGQSYREDPSNSDLRFTRNRVRHDLLPRLTEQFNPGVVEALLRLGRLAGEVQAVVDTAVEDFCKRAVRERKEQCVEVDAGLLRQVSPYLVRELMVTIWRRQGWPRQAMGYREWELLAEMIHAAAGQPDPEVSKRMFPGAVLAEICDYRLHLSRVRETRKPRP